MWESEEGEDDVEVEEASVEEQEPREERIVRNEY